MRFIHLIYLYLFTQRIKTLEKNSVLNTRVYVVQSHDKIYFHPISFLSVCSDFSFISHTKKAEEKDTKRKFYCVCLW